MSVKIKWTAPDGDGILSFNIYRSMIGFVTSGEPSFGLVNGDNFQFAVNGGSTQNIIFDQDYPTASGLVAFLNANTTDATWFVSGFDNSIGVRPDEVTASSTFQIVGGTAVTKFGETSRTISEKSETVLIGNVSISSPLEFEDLDGIDDDYYGISVITSSGEGPMSSLKQAVNFPSSTAIVAANKRDLQEDLIISADEVRNTFLFGLDLTDDNGNEMPDSLIEFYIRSAQQWFEMELGGVKLRETEFVEKHDYRLGDYIQYSFIKLFKYPVQEVSKVSIQFPLQTDVLDFDPTWYRVESVSGHVNLFPTQGTFSSILLSQGGSYIPLIYSGIEYVPHVLHVTYKAGFKNGKVPQNIKEVIGMKAAMGPLNIAGDLIAGAGIASKSISLDGISQSISTTSSATNAGYGARLIQYGKQIDQAMKELRKYYLPINFVVA